MADLIAIFHIIEFLKRPAANHTDSVLNTLSKVGCLVGCVLCPIGSEVI